MDWDKYRSRKLGVTLLVLAATVYLAKEGVMDAHVSLVLSSLIASYNVMQGLVDKGK